MIIQRITPTQLYRTVRQQSFTSNSESTNSDKKHTHHLQRNERITADQAEAISAAIRAKIFRDDELFDSNIDEVTSEYFHYDDDDVIVEKHYSNPLDINYRQYLETLSNNQGTCFETNLLPLDMFSDATTRESALRGCYDKPISDKTRLALGLNYSDAISKELNEIAKLRRVGCDIIHSTLLIEVKNKYKKGYPIDVIAMITNNAKLTDSYPKDTQYLSYPIFELGFKLFDSLPDMPQKAEIIDYAMRASVDTYAGGYQYYNSKSAKLASEICLNSKPERMLSILQIAFE